MLLPLDDLDHAALLALLRERYGVDERELCFSALGEDSWQYRAGSRWVSVRRDIRGHVPGAYRLATRLRERGLSFVLAPVTGSDGEVVHRVGDLPVVVFPYLPVVQMAAGAVSRDDIDFVIAVIRRLHSMSVDADLPSEDYRLSFQEDLELVLRRASRPGPDSGPYAAKLDRLLRSHRQYITDLWKNIEELARSCHSARVAPVLTHGEPSAANFLRNGDQLLLGDWGGAMWGPPERDWFHVGRTIVPEVTRGCRPEQLRFYDIRWRLSEIAEYTTILSQEHHGTEDDHAMWQRLLRYLPE